MSAATGARERRDVPGYGRVLIFPLKPMRNKYGIVSFSHCRVCLCVAKLESEGETLLKRGWCTWSVGLKCRPDRVLGDCRL